MATALITGASSGLGRDFAHLFSQAGDDVVLVARRESRLLDLSHELEMRYGNRATAIEADLARGDATKLITDALEGRRIDYLINNAGFGLIGQFASTSFDVERDMIQVHITATTELTKAILPSMLRQQQGRILNVASIAAFLPGPYAAVYYATKAYLLSWSEALSEELRDTPVTVTTLCPGRTSTGFASRASIPSARWLPRPRPSMPVASAGYRAMLKGRRVIVPGLANQAVACFVRLAPRGLVTRITRIVQGRG